MNDHGTATGDRSTGEDAAREDFQRRLGTRSDSAAEQAYDEHRLPPPSDVTLDEGVGQVTVRWSPVDGAVGYLVLRAADTAEAPLEAVDHGGRDVLAVPGLSYADTTGTPGRRYRYAVASLADVERGPGQPSRSVTGRSLTGEGMSPTVGVTVRADQATGRLRRLWRLIGSERLSQLHVDERTAGRDVADEFAQALRRARDELGVERVRAHAILHDDLGVYREEQGEPVYDFSQVGQIYDRVRDLGLRPMVELSFMPAALARDPDARVFAYDAIISPPRDWARWRELVGRLTAYLVDRYGVDEVVQWGLEVWNEPNLQVFWTGSREEYFRLYAEAARAIKAVDERLPVGGPATAAVGWITDFLDAADDHDVPVDFLSTHTYGNVPLDVRAAAASRGITPRVWWTEWGVTPTHFDAVTDSAFGAPFVLHGMKAAQSSADALAYWVVSDHFEELGRPPRLWHGGFGLLTVGNLRKPRWWALALAEQLGDDLCVVTLGGDGAGSLVDAWASHTAGGRIDVLIWNGTLQQNLDHADRLLDRDVHIRVEGLDAERYRMQLARVDETHSNIRVHDDGGDWPTPGRWTALTTADRLDEEDLGWRTPVDRTVTFDLDLPMPGVARLRLDPS